jgi:hypothetical protein
MLRFSNTLFYLGLREFTRLSDQSERDEKVLGVISQIASVIIFILLLFELTKMPNSSMQKARLISSILVTNLYSNIIYW